MNFSADDAQLALGTIDGHVIHDWDLWAVRERLAAMNLDWDLPPYPPAPAAENREPLRVEVDIGELAAAAPSDSEGNRERTSRHDSETEPTM